MGRMCWGAAVEMQVGVVMVGRLMLYDTLMLQCYEM